MSYDITFCNDSKCTHTECKRNLKNAPKDIPVSVGVCCMCEHYRKKVIMEGLQRKNGHCPCKIQETPENLCPCDEFIETKHCHCSLFVPIKEVK